MQAQGGPGDRQPRTQDDMRRAAKHTVIGRFCVFAGLAGFLVAADQEDRVVGARRNSERGQHGDDERRKAQQIVVAQDRDDPSGGAHFEADHGEYEQHRAHRAIGEEQHDHDDHPGHAHHGQHAFVGGLVHVGGQRGRPGEVNPHPRGRGRAGEDDADRFDRFVAQCAALVAR